MTMPLAHPTRSKLRDWLSSLTPSERVTTHVESCERCAARLVDIADEDVSAGGQATDQDVFAQVVKAQWAPPADLTERVIRSIDQQERNQRDLNVMLGLFGVATETASLMLPPEPDEGHMT